VSSTTLTVWLYDTAMGAAAGEVRLKDLEQQGGLTVLDAVTVTWMPGSHEPKVGHLHHKTSTAAAKGGVLGALVGALALAPAAGAAAGSGIGALADKLRGTGIDRDFLVEVRSKLRPGTSALVVLSRDADVDKVRPFIERGRARGDVTLVSAGLSDGAPDALRQLVRAHLAPPDDGPRDSSVLGESGEDEHT
jgi:uncharacterized membrane protein